MAGGKSFGSPGKQDVPNTLWIGVRDGDPGPIMLAREKPEAFKLKVIKQLFKWIYSKERLILINKI